MMLRSLYELAQREGLLADPDFEQKRVDFLIRVSDSGRFVALVPTADETGRAPERGVPRVPRRTVKVLPGFLFDNAKYVLGISSEGKRDKRSKECADAFREVVRAAAKDTSDEGLRAVTKFLEKLDEQLPKIFSERPKREWTGTEWLAFVRDGDGAKLVHDRPRVRKYWKAQRASAGADGGGEEVRCLVTGAPGSAAALHDSVKRLPNAQTSGASLVSFNASAFESHGLKQGENAPVCRAAAEGYVTALNWLLQGTATRRHRYGVALGGEAVTVFWTREKISAFDALLDLMDPAAGAGDAALAVRAAEAPWRGAPSSADAVPFYAATLSGNAARVVVRDWFESTWGEVRRSVERWFDDLSIGNHPDRPLPIRALLDAAASPAGGLSPDLDGRLFRAALRGGALPRELLGAAIRRIRLPPDRKRPQLEPHLLHARCAIIKAVLRRTFHQEVTVSLDETNRSAPYLLGRLFAVLERLQGEALGDVNATIRDRYFGAASSTPVTVFPRLLRLAVHHASKAERARWLEKLQGQIVAALPARPFPSTLTLEEQGLFAVGYYHQREKFFEKRSEAAAAKVA